MAYVTMDRVSHYYFTPTGSTKALQEISLSIERGEFISIVGPSGCGKSTILSLISGLITPTEGVISISGKPLVEADFSIGYMLQQDYLFPWKTIFDNVLTGPKINHHITESTKEQARELLAEVHLAHTENKYPDALSGGMRQRVSLVRTLMTDPDILLLDEPFSALDYVTKLKLENVVAEMVRTYGKTTILVTHDLAEAISMSDTLVLMQASPGEIAKVFTIPEELRKETPFFVRRHPSYQALFDQVWEQLNEDQAMQVEGSDEQ